MHMGARKGSEDLGSVILFVVHYFGWLLSKALAGFNVFTT